MLHKILSFCICLCFSIYLGPIAFAQDIIKQETPSPQAVKIAIMPVVTTNRNYPKVNELLYTTLQQELHMPLNDTLQTVQYLDENSIISAMRQSTFTYNQNLDTLRTTADLLDVDILVGYSIPHMYQHYYHSISYLDGSALLNSYIHLNLWAYYRPLNKIFKLSDKRQYLDEISPFGMLPELAKDASYTINKKAELKSLLKQSIKIKKGDS